MLYSTVAEPYHYGYFGTKNRNQIILCCQGTVPQPSGILLFLSLFLMTNNVSRLYHILWGGKLPPRLCLPGQCLKNSMCQVINAKYFMLKWFIVNYYFSFWVLKISTVDNGNQGRFHQAFI